ncbi:SPOR domain-containing protein [Maribellus maritimus]|uniref:SPOR domain-containing protein n=1 Tax=Maribellus maritimus TaxID=2870838 RepID=UPI001EEA3D49|nr:SPOR domain-containing protein [Maribellus maritimus]MCG6187925.1 SPOR domain-containing protein [Maribellus maritimus]
MRRLFLSVLMLFFVQTLFAQGSEIAAEEEQAEIKTPAILQRVNVERDERLDKMLNWHIENNKNRNGIDGYRVEIFFSSDMNAKEKAFDKKVEFLSKYPDYNVHVKFVAPNFRVRVGDFRTKNEAWKLYEKIKDDYRAAFVVKDKINFPVLNPIDYE